MSLAMESSADVSFTRNDSRWYFSAEQMADSPSRKCGITADQELLHRQLGANLIQDMGQRLRVSQICINTAIVYMHRFYAFHSFAIFHRNNMAAAALLLAAKVMEQSRRIEYIIKVAHVCLGLTVPDPLKESYKKQVEEMKFNENALIQTLGFDLAIDHPHTHVVKVCQMVKVSKDLAQTAYFLASNILHLTTMSLRYKPTVVACVCINLACKWSRFVIPLSNTGRHWFYYVDKSVTSDLLQKLTDEFLHNYDRCPTRLKSKMIAVRGPSNESDRGSGSKDSSPSSQSTSNTAQPNDKADSPSSTHSKQSTSNGDLELKPSSSSCKNPSSSLSSSSRSLSERSSQKHDQQKDTTQNGLSDKVSKAHNDSPANMPSQSSSTSSSVKRADYKNDNARDHKNRMVSTTTSGSSSSSMQMHSNGQHKTDRHSRKNSQKSYTSQRSHIESINPIKTKESMVPLVDSVQDVAPQTSSSSKVKRPPSSSQSMNDLPSRESVSDPSKPPGSTFRLIDDTDLFTEPALISTPPKRSKPSSIFSPDWEDTKVENNNRSVFNVNTSNSGGKSRSQVQLVDLFTAPSDGTHQSRSNEIESFSPNSSGCLIKLLDPTSTPSVPLPLLDQADIDLSGLGRPAKRSLPSNEPAHHDNGTDYRQTKIRKVETQRLSVPLQQCSNSNPAPAYITTGSEVIQTPTSETLPISSKDDEHHRSKSGKKKKKNKHKNKDSDETRDRDRKERKKHKKDKDRHHERKRSDSSTASSGGPIETNQPRDSLSTNGNPHTPRLIVKIPKDRLSRSFLRSIAATKPVHSGDRQRSASYYSK
ncbi:cyclin-T-like [Toxorhynchites rutilus septentrionalis]|uniref:cyclin-T-like n=1 Tax=Toxorhynchites rutilus septentrionalis TaxID=329112 RepID=UPI0024787B78|nr:cyclin-T-like [Toxorhynchites rutilus septentrionalis]